MNQLKRDDDESFYFSAKHDLRSGKSGSTQHYHSLFEIYYLTHGTCRYFIDNKSYLVEAGDILLIPPGIIHKSQYHDENYARLLINCSKFYIPGTVFKVLPKLIYVYRNDKIAEKIKEIFTSIEESYSHPDAFSDDYLRALMHSFFVLIARNENKKAPDSNKNVYTEKAISYIHKNFAQSVTLYDVAALCAVSPEHLSRIFKKETGFGFSEFLTHVRLQHAEFLLKNSLLSITEIAHQCGFGDSNYFSQIFKRNYNFTPSAVRKANFTP